MVTWRASCPLIPIPFEGKRYSNCCTIAPCKNLRQTTVQSGEILDNTLLFAMVCEDPLASTKDNIYENDYVSFLGPVTLYGHGAG